MPNQNKQWGGWFGSFVIGEEKSLGGMDRHLNGASIAMKYKHTEGGGGKVGFGPDSNHKKEKKRVRNRRKPQSLGCQITTLDYPVYEQRNNRRKPFGVQPFSGEGDVTKKRRGDTMVEEYLQNVVCQKSDTRRIMAWGNLGRLGGDWGGDGPKKNGEKIHG